MKTTVRFKPFCECCENVEIDVDNQFNALCLLLDFINEQTPYFVELEVAV